MNSPFAIFDQVTLHDRPLTPMSDFTRYLIATYTGRMDEWREMFPHG